MEFAKTSNFSKTEFVENKKIQKIKFFETLIW